MNINKLRGIMAEQRLTQRDVARKIGIAENTLSNKLNGRCAFNTDEAVAICNLLRIDDPAVRADIFLSQTS